MSLTSPDGAPLQEDAGALEVLTQSPTPLRRLTREQYAASVQQALPVAEVPEVARFAADERAGPFEANTVSPVSAVQVDQYAQAAATIARRVARGVDAGCGEACALPLLESLGARLWRRTLAPDEKAALAGLYRQGASDGVAAGLELALSALLESPDFLYRVEVGPGDGGVLLAPHELASRLSFFLWNSGPDEALLEAAASGALGDEEGVRAQVRRLQGDERFRAQVGRFHLSLLRLSALSSLDKDRRRYPFFDDSVGPAMQLEVQAFADFVLRADGRLSTLLSAPLAFPSGKLFDIYGLKPVPQPRWPLPVGVDPAQRAGLLTLPGVQAAQAQLALTGPIQRGVLVLENLLCVSLGSPPNDVSIAPVPAGTATASRRDTFAAHTSRASCRGCHVLIDPLGFAFEGYDAVGAHRTFDVDEQRPVDASATVAVGLEGVDGPVRSGVELARRLATSPAVRACYARQWFRFAHGRGDVAEDLDAVERLQARFEAGQGHIPSLLEAIAVSPEFQSRGAP